MTALKGRVTAPSEGTEVKGTGDECGKFDHIFEQDQGGHSQKQMDQQREIVNKQH